MGGSDAMQLTRLDREALVVQDLDHVGMGEIARPQLLDARNEGVIFEGGVIFGGEIPAAELNLICSFACVA